MSTLKIRKVGNSLGVIFPKELQEVLKINEGDFIDVTTIDEGKLMLEAQLTHHSQWTFHANKLNKEDQAWIHADLENDDEKSPRW